MSRTATEADVEAIAAIERSCFGASAWSEGLVRDEVVSDRHVVLVTDDLAAYAAASLAGETADLDRIAVLPAARGRGLARDLLTDLVDRVRDLGADRMLLEVAADNAAAIGLYEAHGFDTISTRRGYYAGGIDALVMEITIAEWR
ncbi:ribosomal protein S18-alanine N-acetyltransferase [Aeromicrobium chenweiae]|uniref:[Ribosomal protein bS18]-alanine N-acetyltransferase n=1 Tax=Aeromicrobium chenweiae TaxID=2079793 RepID=A0A2S0WPV2_9ACTN|nr:ribosomal protein S18-alanine N-acetyltransferase [Aeromicrobium chenweiae]AWB93346.1 ribosomal-protein-alanine N-acetyltransferase [Aeromicrobium chenweiae]TGN34336.1 ribosomal-protein-alanine N-acetyltransferase [Aeromicrobium chenweiae]